MSHLDDGILAELIDGELDPAASEAATRHLASCAECRARYEEAQRFATESDRLIAGVVPREPLRGQARTARSPHHRWRIPWRAVGWAASVVAAAGLGYYAGVPRPGSGDTEVPRAAALAVGESSAKALPASPAQNAPAPPMRQNAEVTAGTQQPSADAATVKALELPAPAKPAPAEPAAEEERPQVSVGKAEPRQAWAPAAAAPPSVAGLSSGLRLIEGLAPLRMEGAMAQDARQTSGESGPVRVVYPDPPSRELWLDQWQGQPRPERDGRVATLLAGDTVLTTLPDGRHRLEWLGPDGVRLALSGFLPADSLKALARRVR